MSTSEFILTLDMLLTEDHLTEMKVHCMDQFSPGLDYIWVDEFQTFGVEMTVSLDGPLSVVASDLGWTSTCLHSPKLNRVVFALFPLDVHIWNIIKLKKHFFLPFWTRHASK